MRTRIHRAWTLVGVTVCLAACNALSGVGDLAVETAAEAESRKAERGESPATSTTSADAGTLGDDPLGPGEGGTGSEGGGSPDAGGGGSGSDAAVKPDSGGTGGCEWRNVDVCLSGATIAAFCGAGQTVKTLERCDSVTIIPTSSYTNTYLLSECLSPACPTAGGHVLFKRVECCPK